MKPTLTLILCAGCAMFQGCGRNASANAGTNVTPASTAPGTAADVAPPPPPPEVLAAGTRLHVRLDEAIDTRRNRPGDAFTATLEEPLVSGDHVVVPSGITFSGHITQAKPSGRLSGRAVLALRLESFDLNGRTYRIDSARSTVSRGHKKHNLLWIGGSSAGGATIGAAAAGGPAALIGAGAGAAAGTIGAAFTGKRQIDFPAETQLTFRLAGDVQIGG